MHAYELKLSRSTAWYPVCMRLARGDTLLGPNAAGESLADTMSGSHFPSADAAGLSENCKQQALADVIEMPLM